MKVAFSEISVVIPAFNAGKYLREALASVLAQTWAASEIIVVDDGSSDDTAQIAADFSAIRVIKKNHSGIAATRNVGIEAATGKYLAFLDADDLWLPEKLEKQLALLRGEPATKGVFGQLLQFVSPELSEAEKARFATSAAPVAGYVAGTLLIERDAFLQVGLFNETLFAGEFVEWMMRARRLRIEFKVIDELVTLRRIHGHNTTLTERSNIHKAYLQIARGKMKKAE